VDISCTWHCHSRVILREANLSVVERTLRIGHLCCYHPFSLDESLPGTATVYISLLLTSDPLSEIILARVPAERGGAFAGNHGESEQTER
jgi:hypothetical protein